MEKYLECYNNPLIQLLHEFDMFLYVIYHDAKNNQYLNNVFNDSRRIHLRVLIDFFNNKKNHKSNDDLCCEDFLQGQQDLSVNADKDLIKFINKDTFHFTAVRGAYMQSFDPTQWFVCVSKQLIKRIHQFLALMDTSLAENYKAFFCPEVEKLRSAILAKIIKINLISAIYNGEIETLYSK